MKVNDLVTHRYTHPPEPDKIPVYRVTAINKLGTHFQAIRLKYESWRDTPSFWRAVKSYVPYKEEDMSSKQKTVSVQPNYLKYIPPRKGHYKLDQTCDILPREMGPAHHTWLGFTTMLEQKKGYVALKGGYGTIGTFNAAGLRKWAATFIELADALDKVNADDDEE